MSMIAAGAYVRRLRELAGISQSVVADRLGVSVDTIFNWESGKTEATVVRFHWYAALVGADPVQLHHLLTNEAATAETGIAAAQSRIHHSNPRPTIAQLLALSDDELINLLSHRLGRKRR